MARKHMMEILIAIGIIENNISLVTRHNASHCAEHGKAERRITMETNVIPMKDYQIPEMLTISELSQRTGLSYSFIRKLCLQKKIVHIKAGNKYLINLNRFLDFLDTGTE